MCMSHNILVKKNYLNFGNFNFFGQEIVIISQY